MNPYDNGMTLHSLVITQFTKCLLAHNSNLVKMCCIYWNDDDPIRSQLCTCHDSSATIKCANLWFNESSGPRFNIKIPSYQYRKSHCGDKTILRPSYLHNGISYTGKMTSLYWIGPQNHNSTYDSFHFYELINCLWNGSNDAIGR